MKTKALACAAVAVFTAGSAMGQAITLNANTTANNGGAANWGILFDLTATSGNLIVTEMTTFSTAAANAAFTIEVFQRTGTALGGPVGTGAGSSSAGWTLLGTANATQGATVNGLSLPIDIPDILLTQGQTAGIALVFRGAGPRYFGTGAAPLQTFSDSNLTLLAGDARSAPFTTGGSFFSSRALSGSLTYIPTPGSVALLGMAGLLAARRRR